MVHDGGDERYSFARGTMWVAFGLICLIRLVNGMADGQGWLGLLLAMAPYPALVLVLARRRGPGAAFWLLAAVVLLYALPFSIVGTHWSWLPWPLAVAVLCLCPPRLAWPLFGAVLLGTGVFGFLSGAQLDAALTSVFQAGDDGLILFGFYAFAGMVDNLSAARGELARLAAIRERLRMDGELKAVVGGGLREIGSRLARVDGAQGSAGPAIRQATELARRTLTDIRATASAYRTSGGQPSPVPIESTRLAWFVLLGVVALNSAIQCFFLLSLPDPQPVWLIPTVAYYAAVGILVLMRPAAIRHVLLVLLVVVGYLAHFVAPDLGVLSAMWGFVLGVALVQVGPRRSWLVAVVIFGLYAALLPYPPPVPSVPGVIEQIVSVAILAWLTFSMIRLSDLVSVLHRTRHELTESVVARERLRIARDLHDVLGFSLSAVTLRGALCERLLDADPARARAELVTLRGLVERALTELDSITQERTGLRLEGEFVAARDVLTSAGIGTTTEIGVQALPEAVDASLAVVLREAVTNVVRHSTARTCAIEVTHTGGVARLRVVNDGARRRGEAGGSGLIGLTERTGGRLRTRYLPDDRFELIAEFVVDHDAEYAVTGLAS